ncbi:hypothetical protein [Phnomibacter sp. MR]|uniref:hypothetical protein n=1 Tax=Phnomibacter sp. MR TaxID=3042318 RepID=UPI003A80FD54
MGLFLSLSSVVGKSKEEVLFALKKYAASVSGDLVKSDSIECVESNIAKVQEANGNVTIYYPSDYLEWDDSAEFISKELNAPVFSFHIHDGDFWMYHFFVNGEVRDQFNPYPEYWDDESGKEVHEQWMGNAEAMLDYFPHLTKADISAYLVHWDTDENGDEKAYDSDEYGRIDWQLLDFMKKLNLPCEMSEDGEFEGDDYTIWTSRLPINNNKLQAKQDTAIQFASKPWWKFW